MPQWLTSSVIYEINVPTFSAAGNFASVTAKLGDIDALGANLLWLMPIHPLGKLRAKPPFGSEYAIRDYYGINPDYGTADDLHALIRGAHGRKMRVIIDIVANHTAWDSVMMEHPDFYKHDAAGRIAQPNDDWTDVAGLDYSNPRLRTYMIQMLTYWLREFDLDGFRCDVAGLVPTDFWEQARPELERVKPDLMMLAEWGEPDLLRRAFDIDYSWDLYKSLRAVMTTGAPATDFRRTWEQQQARFAPGALHLRYSQNHDEENAIAVFGENGSMAAAFLMFTLDGVPMIYNGQEVGDSTESGGDAMFHRLKVFWEIQSRRPQFLPFYKRLVSLRRNSTTLQRGDLAWVDHPAADRAVLFDRRLQGGSPASIVRLAVNLTNRPTVLSLPDWGQFREIDSGAGAQQRVDLGAWEGRIWGQT
jgi:glycosidase